MSEDADAGFRDEVALFGVVVLAVGALVTPLLGPVPGTNYAVALVVAGGVVAAARRGRLQSALGYESDGRFYDEAATFGGWFFLGLVALSAAVGLALGPREYWHPLWAVAFAPGAAVVGGVSVRLRRRWLD